MSQVYVFVAASQHDQYIHLEKDYGLTVVIGGDGILAQRNAIIQYSPEGARIVEMDDDIEDIKNLGVDPVVSVECLVSLFAQSFEKLNKYGGVGLWGLNSTTNRWMTKPEDLTVKIGLYQIVNSVLGYINDKRVKLTTPVMEDFERVCIFHELHLPILKQTEFGIKTKYWFNAAGIAMRALAVLPSNKCGAHETFHDWSIHPYAATCVVPSVSRAFLWAFLWAFLKRFCERNRPKVS
jgi:hypothetical protein